MFSYSKKNWSKQTLASWLVFVFFVFVLLLNILSKNEALAQNATVPMQIIQQITQKINWAKDYANQQKQKTYTKTTADIQKWTKSDILNQRSLKKSWNQTRKSLLDQLVNNILDSVKNMGGGATAFVSDWKSFLGNFTQQAFQNFVNDQLGQVQMCDLFDSEIKQEISAGNEPPFSTQVQCPVSDINALYNGTSNDFWSDWLNAIRPSGNPFGAYMIAADEKIKTEALAYTGRIYKLTADQGFQGTEDTPGIIQSYASQRASMMDLDYLLQSKDLNEYFGSVIDAFINRISNEGLSKMQTGTYAPKGSPPQVTISPQDQDIDYVKANQEYVYGIFDMLGLTKENLQALLVELNRNSLANASEIFQTQTKITDTDIAIADVDDLIKKMGYVLTAEANGSQVLISQSLANFKLALSKATNSLQILINTNETDLQRLYLLLDNYDTQIVNRINSLIVSQNSFGN